MVDTNRVERIEISVVVADVVVADMDVAVLVQLIAHLAVAANVNVMELVQQIECLAEKMLEFVWAIECRHRIYFCNKNDVENQSKCKEYYFCIIQSHSNVLLFFSVCSYVFEYSTFHVVFAIMFRVLFVIGVYDVKKNYENIVHLFEILFPGRLIEA